MKWFKSVTYLVIVFTFSACLKNENSVLQQQEQEDQLISDFLRRNSVVATRSPTGLYYVIDQAGVGAQASSTTQIASIDVNVFLLGGARFISEKDVVYRFQNGLLMQGIVEATTLLRKGGNGRFYIPSHLGFGGSSGTVSNINIPANASLYAEVKLNDIRTDDEQLKIETDSIKSYLMRRKLTPTKDSLGVFYVMQTAGTGTQPRTGNRVTLSYKGTLLNGQTFDSGGFTFTIGSGNVIRGFDIATRLMRKGEKGIAIIPSNLGYGDKGSGDKISPFDVLIFELEMTGLE
jgi:FKBP-type peptidyl-prolyl cis-trans isomerase